MLARGLLEERLRSSEVFPPKVKEITLNFQQLFPFTGPVVTEILRDFYEGVAQALFAGDVRDRINEKAGSIEPDLTSVSRRRYIEVKAAGHTRRVMLKDDQIDKYVRLQLSEKPIKGPRVYFVIFRYGVRGIERQVQGFSREEVISYLCGDTKFMIGLPFSVIHKTHREGYGRNNLFTRCESARSVPCTNFSTRAIDLFFSDPAGAISRIGLDPNNYDIKLRRTSDEIVINSFSLNPFPMVLIKESDGYIGEWTQRLKEETGENVPF